MTPTSWAAGTSSSISVSVISYSLSCTYHFWPDCSACGSSLPPSIRYSLTKCPSCPCLKHQIMAWPCKVPWWHFLRCAHLHQGLIGAQPFATGIDKCSQKAPMAMLLASILYSVEIQNYSPCQSEFSSSDMEGNPLDGPILAQWWRPSQPATKNFRPDVWPLASVIIVIGPFESASLSTLS